MILTGPRYRAEHPSCHLARQMFERVLAAWAMDVLDLRRRGLDRPGHRIAGTPLTAPLDETAADLEYVQY